MSNLHIPVNESEELLVSAANIREKIKTFPEQPGCYIMKDNSGTVIYIGKTISLKHRVANYFTDSASREPYYAEKIAQLRGMIADIDFISTANENGILLLENE